MCGRYVISKPVSKTVDLVKTNIKVEDVDNFNAHPSQKLPVIPIGVNGLKEVLFNRLKVTEPGPAYIHISHDFDDEFCLQLTAEKQVRKFTHGIQKIEWVKIRGRNEALDLVVFALACFTMLT